VERLWLAMALAQLWCVSLGCQAEAQLEATWLQNEPGASLAERHIAHRGRTRAAGQLPPRRLSCVVRGRLVLLALQYQSEPFPVGILRAGPWPQTITAPRKQLKPSALNKKKTQKEKERRKRQKRRARERARAQGQKIYTCKPPPPPQAAAPAPSGGLTDDDIAQLKQLGQLHGSGVLTDAEFEAAKQKILG